MRPLTDEILHGIYRIEVPLPRNPLRAINCYLIKGDGRTLIVDTGMNREECRTALRDGLRELGVDLAKADLLITHMHADHSGLVSDLVAEGATPYCSQPDAEAINFGLDWDAMLRDAVTAGFSRGQLQQFPDEHPGYRYRARGQVSFRIVREGDVLTIGDYSFRCVETPGHTSGHICLYDPQHALLLSGDHVLSDITPNITGWLGDGSNLEQYLSSLDRIYQLDVKRLLPGHRRPFGDCKERIRELRHHHQVRADQVLSILDEGALDAFHVASMMSWDISYDSFQQFPLAQQWFAVGEALAHIQYLEARGLIRRTSENGTILYSR